MAALARRIDVKEKKMVIHPKGKPKNKVLSDSVYSHGQRVKRAERTSVRIRIQSHGARPAHADAIIFRILMYTLIWLGACLLLALPSTASGPTPRTASTGEAVVFYHGGVDGLYAKNI